MLNGGSYIGIPMSIRKEVWPVCERFIEDHIAAGKDFATETTLRSTIGFDQMKQAHEAGFAWSSPIFVSTILPRPRQGYDKGIWAGIAVQRRPFRTFGPRAF